jgi:hypothetical protein
VISALDASFYGTGLLCSLSHFCFRNDCELGLHLISGTVRNHRGIPEHAQLFKNRAISHDPGHSAGVEAALMNNQPKGLDLVEKLGAGGKIVMTPG